MGRYIGIRHRVKQTAAGEARPTQVTVLNEQGEVLATHDLEDETAELDFVLGRFPVTRRKVTPGEDLLAFRDDHLGWRKIRAGETLDGLPPEFVKIEQKKTYVLSHVPSSYDGLQVGDTVAMVLGGSGDYMAYALANRAQHLGAGTGVFRLPPSLLKKLRADALILDSDKDRDAKLLAEAVKSSQRMFQQTGPRELGLILVQMQWRALAETIEARIACSQRLYQLAIGRAFCSMEGQYPAGMLTKYIDELKANDTGLQALKAEERARERELVKILEQIDVYQKLFKPVVEGCGPRIAARLIASVGTASRFSTAAKMVAFCGVHVLPDGRFPRRRAGELANWPDAPRQALYLLADQFNRRPDSVWGQKLRLNKARARGRHPFPVVVVKNEQGVETATHELRPGMFEYDKKNGRYVIQTDTGEMAVTGTLRYGDAHIHNMAVWRTLTQFTKWLWREWSRLDRASAAVPPPVARVV